MECIKTEATGERSGSTDVEMLVSYNGEKYPVLVHVPAAAKERSLPLVLNLHGSSSSGAAQMDLSGLRELADEQSFVVVAPTGVIPIPSHFGEPSPDGWAWNVPGVPLTSGEHPAADTRDDIGFLTEVIRVVSADLQTDPDRVYGTGFSGGARMISALALALPGTFAAIAPVAGLRAGPPNADDPARPREHSTPLLTPVPVLTFHGDADPVNPFGGNSDMRWGYSLTCAVAQWTRLNGCTTGPTRERLGGNVTFEAWTNGTNASEVQAYVIEGGGHDWPGAVAQWWPPAVEHQLNAANIIAGFFAKHRLLREL